MAAEDIAPRYSLIVPVYNEADSLKSLLAEIRNTMDSLGDPYEVLFVDDGSTDCSLPVMKSLLRDYPVVRILVFEKHAGQSAALAAGFEAARGRVFLTLDADLQNDPRDIPRLLSALKGYDVAVGWRHERRDNLVKRITSKVGNAVRNRLTHEQIADTGCSLKAFRRETCRSIPFFDGMHRFMPTLCRMRGFTVTQVKVNHRPRVHGKSKYGVVDRLLVTIPDLMAVRWMQKRALHYRAHEESGQ
jgi:glycosyltransferase involved in cell wall biosynthesis